MPTLQIESTLKGLVGGVDEAGVGPWAGPVVAATAVFLDPQSLPSFLEDGIQDSKKLSKAKRETFFNELTKLEAFHYGIGIASVDEIDQLNILRATLLAMKRSTDNLPQKPSSLLVDGKHTPAFEGHTRSLVGGDGISLSIAAASILAKVTRDKIMEELALAHPHYGWEKNAGYGTAQHQAALKIHGVTPHHRKSFAPIKALL
jgi:ribonuclease HII